MLFYKIEAEMLDRQASEDKERQKEYARELSAKFEVFYQRHAKKAFLFIAFMREKKITLGAITHADSIPEEVIKSFFDMVEIQCRGTQKEEITLKAMASLLSVSCRNDYIKDDDEILEYFELDELSNRFSCGRYRFEESILHETASKADLLKFSERMLCKETLSPEIIRIYKGTKQKNAYGHPVHYLIQTDDCSIRDKIVAILLSALYANHRIKSKRYCTIRCSSHNGPPEKYLDLLYKSCIGGAFVISYTSQHEEDDDYTENNADVIIRMCAMMKKYKNDVLTVFCLSKSCEQIKATFFENLGTTTLVTLNEEIIFGKKAKNYLHQLALSHAVTADKSLYRNVRDLDRGYLAADLNREFDFWFANRLKTSVYPQYAVLDAANKTVVTSKPKGSAYEELQKMIGLEDAKSVIGQALDYYKAQKLFRVSGMQPSHPTMHMVFTGNPGTAKTTVARLFARIMKENGLLTKGNLYECGRADLVGKYVGWTARIVREKFKAAQGSVLFIDEAYSLVDEKEGMYGDEAISTIVQEMENRREDLVVIFAGYSDKMEEFLQRNPGLRSRIAFHVPFRDYGAEDLYQITELLAEKEEIRLAAGVREKLLPIFDKALKNSDFGNGRFARNLFEKARMKQAGRLVHADIDRISKEDVATLLPEDFEPTEYTPQTKKKTIGFLW